MSLSYPALGAEPTPGIMVKLNSNGQYWQASWTDDTGRRHRQSIGPKSTIGRREAARMCEQIAREHAIMPAKRSIRTTPTLREWTDAYLALVTQTHAAGTVTLTRETVAYLFRRFGEDRRLDQITPAEADDFVLWLKGMGLREATVCRHVRTCKTMWSRAVKRRVAAESPWSDCRSTPRKVTRDALNLTDADIGRLVDAANSDGWRALVALCAWAGLRRGEALRVRWQDCQFDRHRIVVRLPDGKLDPDTKHAERTVLMVPELDAVLRGCFDRAPSGSQGPCETIPADNLDRDMIALVRRAGLTPWPKPFHALRAWRVSTWKLRYPSPVVDRWIGHSAEVSDTHYFGVRDEVFAAEAEIARLREQLAKLEKEKHEAADAR